MKKIICAVYRSSKKSDTYLYVDKQKGLTLVPEGLLTLFGTPIDVMTLLLHAERPLAQADVVKVLEAIEQVGYYLQLPKPSDDEYMNKIGLLNEKISR